MLTGKIHSGILSKEGQENWDLIFQPKTKKCCGNCDKEGECVTNKQEPDKSSGNTTETKEKVD